MKIKSLLVGLVACLVLFTSCDKDKKAAKNAGTVTLKFNYVWGMGSASPFQLNDTLIHPMSGDTMSFDMVKHYISNIKLVNDLGEEWAEYESYHLLDVSDTNSLSITIDSVPADNYTSVIVTFGVDSTRNVSGAQTGALDVANGMFWSWNTGYIMTKVEGISPNAEGGTFRFHMGGFSGENSVVNTRTFTLSSNMVLEKQGAKTINFTANPAKFFHTFGSVSNGSFHMPGANAKTMADDFNNAISISSVE